MDPKNQGISKQNKQNMLLAALLGLIGILTLVIVMAAVLGGLALDKHFDTQPWFTIGLLVASIPVSLLVMVWVARKTIKRIKTTDSEETGEEDAIGKRT